MGIARRVAGCQHFAALDALQCIVIICLPIQVLRRIAASRPAYPAGSSSGYHGVRANSPRAHNLSLATPRPMLLCHPLAPAGHSGGYVVGEVIRRVTGCTLRDFVSRELASPLGVEFYMGVPNSHVMSRVSKVKCSIPPPLSIAPNAAQKRRKNSNARCASATWAGPTRTRRLSKTRTLLTTTRRTTSRPPSCSASWPWWNKARPATRRSRSTAPSARTWRVCSIGLTF